VLGRRGAGKSNALMVLFEHELDAGHRAVMIDPKGDRWGVRLNPDGSPSRYDIPVFGGEHGDLPVEAPMGELLGRLVAEHNLSCLIDLSRLSLGEKQKFMLGFAPELLQHNREALTLFIEEVDQFANQDPRYQPPMLVHHIAQLLDARPPARHRPLGRFAAPAKVNATVRSQADTFVGMKVTNPLDRDAFRDWFKGHGKGAAARVDAEIGSLRAGRSAGVGRRDRVLRQGLFPDGGNLRQRPHAQARRDDRRGLAAEDRPLGRPSRVGGRRRGARRPESGKAGKPEIWLARICSRNPSARRPHRRARGPAGQRAGERPKAPAKRLLLAPLLRIAGQAPRANPRRHRRSERLPTRS
jgi:hypothetical protein